MNQAEYYAIDGTDGFVEMAGDGQPLLCIHTAGQTGVQWRGVMRDLSARGYQVIVPDLPGHGRSDNAPGGPVLDLSIYTRWLTGLLSVLDVANPLLLGCSIGGKIALELAANPDLQPRGVVAMATDAYNSQLSISGLRRGLEDSGSPSRADRTYYGVLASVGRDVPHERAEAVAGMHRREDPVVSTADLIGWATHDLRGRLADIRCPVLMVAGEDDFWIDAEDVSWAASQITHGRYEFLPRVGHYPMEEIAGFPALLMTWFDQLLGDGRDD